MAKKSIPAINDFELDNEKPISPRRMWLKTHMYLVYIGAAVLLIIAIFFGIRIYKNASHPLTKFMSASAKDFNSSFSFEVNATENGKSVMKYTGSYEADPAKQNVKVIYDADYVTYTYTGAVSSEGNTRISGNLYDGKWRVHDCSERVLNFFDFNTDYRAGGFDSASFLRFTDLTSSFSAEELNGFMKLFKNRMDGGSPLAKVDITSENGSKVYTYDVNLAEFFSLVRDKGAPIFFSSIDYDKFCALYELNEKTIAGSECRFVYTIDDQGWLTDMSLTLTLGEEEYAVNCTMSDFGTAEVKIPDEFYNTPIEEPEK